MRQIDEAPTKVRDAELDAPVVTSPIAQPRDIPEPPWLRALAFILASAALSFGFVGLLLVVFGVYRPALAYALATPTWVGLVALVWPYIMRSDASHPAGTRDRAHVVAAVGVLAILLITGWHAANESQHVLINRDGGAYVNEGRWIARHGALEVQPKVGPFANEHTLEYESYAVHQMPDGTLQFQFAHLLPVLLAEAYAIGGDRALFHLPAFLAGVALLAFFVLAWRLLRRPWFALGATLALAFLIPQVSFSRDAYSEIPSQVLLFTAVWLLASDDILPPARVAFTAGLFVGALQATRIDAMVFLVGVPPLLAIAWIRSRRCNTPPRADVLQRGAVFVVGVVPGVAIGLVDVMHHSGHYYRDLSHNVRRLFGALVVTLVVSLIAVALWPVIKRAVARVPVRAAARVIGTAVVLLGFGAWALRPALQTLHGPPVGLVAELQTLEHAPVIDATRQYYEYSLTWMSWYLGPLTVAAAILGAGVLVCAWLMRRQLRTLGPAALLAPASALYLWRAEALSDHVWATRRFLVSAFPSFVLLAFGLAAFAFGWIRPGGMSRAVRVAAIAVAVVAVAFPMRAVWGVRNMTEQRGYADMVHDACRAMGDGRHAVVVLERDERDLFDDWTPQALRGWCGADVAVMRGTPDPAVLQRLARAWDALGRNVYVVAVSAEPVRAAVGDAEPLTTRRVVNARLLAPTLTHRPDKYTTQSLSMVLALVPPG